jgi:hypothetical protein
MCNMTRGGIYLKQVINEACNNVSSYKMTMITPFTHTKNVNEWNNMENSLNT